MRVAKRLSVRADTPPEVGGARAKGEEGKGSLVQRTREATDRKRCPSDTRKPRVLSSVSPAPSRFSRCCCVERGDRDRWQPAVSRDLRVSFLGFPELEE